MTNQIDIKDFARRVERMCDFFIAKRTEEKINDGSSDLLVLEELKDEAADIQFDRVHVVSGMLNGLSDYMRGHEHAPKQKD